MEAYKQLGLGKERTPRILHPERNEEAAMESGSCLEHRSLVGMVFHLAAVWSPWALSEIMVTIVTSPHCHCVT